MKNSTEIEKYLAATTEPKGVTFDQWMYMREKQMKITILNTTTEESISINGGSPRCSLTFELDGEKLNVVFDPVALYTFHMHPHKAFSFHKVP